MYREWQRTKEKQSKDMIKEKHYDLILIIMKTFGFRLCRASLLD